MWQRKNIEWGLVGVFSTQRKGVALPIPKQGQNKGNTVLLSSEMSSAQNNDQNTQRNLKASLNQNQNVKKRQSSKLGFYFQKQDKKGANKKDSSLLLTASSWTNKATAKTVGT